jgi:hypothetical protein
MEVQDLQFRGSKSIGEEGGSYTPRGKSTRWRPVTGSTDQVGPVLPTVMSTWRGGGAFTGETWGTGTSDRTGRYLRPGQGGTTGLGTGRGTGRAPQFPGNIL